MQDYRILNRGKFYCLQNEWTSQYGTVTTKKINIHWSLTLGIKKKKKLKQQNGDHQKLCEREVGHLNQITQHFSSVAEIISSGPLHSLVTKNSTPRPSKLLRDRMIVIAFTTKERIWSSEGFDN